MTKVRTQTGNFTYAKYQLKRSILENALEDDYTTEDYEAALKFFGGCAFCGARQPPRKDHLVPVIKCGDFVRRNVVPACQKCDDSKGRKEYHEWMLNSNSRHSFMVKSRSSLKVSGHGGPSNFSWSSLALQTANTLAFGVISEVIAVMTRSRRESGSD